MIAGILASDGYLIAMLVVLAVELVAVAILGIRALVEAYHRELHADDIRHIAALADLAMHEAHMQGSAAYSADRVEPTPAPGQPSPGAGTTPRSAVTDALTRGGGPTPTPVGAGLPDTAPTGPAR